jgi:hypothetical protein
MYVLRVSLQGKSCRSESGGGDEDGGSAPKRVKCQPSREVHSMVADEKEIAEVKEELEAGGEGKGQLRLSGRFASQLDVE